MKDCREEWFDAENKVSVVVADVTSAAQELAKRHLCGPVAAHYLAKGLAAAALLGAEAAGEDETIVIQLKCTGPLGGLNVECSSDGALRGYTEKKTLDDFDGLGGPDDTKVLGARRLQITRSVPGRLLSQGVAESLDAYVRDSLQRNAFIALEASVSYEVEVLGARGILVESMPDGGTLPSLKPGKLARSSRSILEALGLGRAELKRTTPLFFRCKCSPERALATLAAIPDDERSSLPETIDITCHMCGRTYAVRTGAGARPEESAFP